MIALCIYLWGCTTFAALAAIFTVRPVHRGDVFRAVLFPVLFPIFFIAHITRKVS